MPSAFGWVDFVEEDRRKMLDVIHLFRERNTRDELGIGTIRDAFSDYLFPGTTSVQTRVRYMLFVPWIYERLEWKRVPSAQIAQKARNAETYLISSLLKTESAEGVIGSEAGKGLKRLPSNIYWSGLKAWGILFFDGSQEEYHRSLDKFYALQSPRSRYAHEIDEEYHDTRIRPNWHPGLPHPPKGFPDNATLTLRKEDAAYLKERVLTKHGDSLLSELLRRGDTCKTDFPWEHPIVSSLSGNLRDNLEQVRNFSEVMHGAAILYNLLLSREIKKEEWVNRYEGMISKWKEKIDSRKADLDAWYKKIDEFWRSPALSETLIPIPTKHFVDSWISFTLSSPGIHKLSDDPQVATTLMEREVALKRNRARLANHRPRELWQGQSGIHQLEYRWSVASGFVDDIVKGLHHGKAAA